MNRLFSRILLDWLHQPGRKPLVLRGARQVGKTWLVRELARQSGRQLIEVNFERNPEYARYFSSNDPRLIMGELSLALNCKLDADKTLLFLDEIQAAGPLLAKLRWFAEEMPELPVIAAGSLLEFTLADHDFSMPVGRVAFRHIEPMGFEEYLLAHSQEVLLQTLGNWRVGTELSAAAHDQASLWFHRFSMVGGMPAVVAADVAGASASECRSLQVDLMTAFRSDFSKYRGRLSTSITDTVLRGAANSIGRKFIYAQAGDGVKQYQAKQALESLASARLCHLVRWSAANGLPLAAESKDSFRKAILLDVGLLHAMAGTPAMGVFPKTQDLPPDLRNAMTEQMAAQSLRLLQGMHGNEPQLFYWQREGGRPGEIDLLTALHGRIVPIELKSGAAGSMKSLHQFMFDKKLGLAVRCDTNPPSVVDLELSTTQGDKVKYRLLSLPHYLLWNLEAIVGEDTEL
jgi:uncharacterized protein